MYPIDGFGRPVALMLVALGLIIIGARAALAAYRAMRAEQLDDHRIEHARIHEPSPHVSVSRRPYDWARSAPPRTLP